MSRPAAADAGLARAVKAELDSLVVTVELTLISIIQGVAPAVLAGSSLQPVLTLRWETWPYVVNGMLIILLFWSRAVIHTPDPAAGLG